MPLDSALAARRFEAGMAGERWHNMAGVNL